jgi:Flp pilus assembly protein TadG
MNAENCQKFSQKSSFLRRLRQDRSGNVMAIMTSFLIPMTALVGSAVDMSRTFVTKTRLQQACDAGALAGRKLLTASTGTQLDSAALSQANAFFQNNFTTGWMGTTGVSFTPVRTTDGQVNATATATVPMTVMKIFGNDSASTTVNCTARYDLPDLDVMFVLDTTGSMAWKTDNSCPSGGEAGAPDVTTYTRPDGSTGYRRKLCGQSKLAGLRTGVLSFFDTVASTLSAGAKVRYGFVTYSSAVNTGFLLNSNQIADSWTYPSRWIYDDYNRGSPTDETRIGISSSDCNTSNPALNYRDPAGVKAFTTAGLANKYSVVAGSWTSANGGTCALKRQQVSPLWRYENVTLDTSQYKLGGVVDDPSKITSATSRWQGCVEERGNAAPASTFDINNLPADLHPDLPATDNATRWRPMWPDVVYYRDSNPSVTNAGDSTNPYGDSTNTTGQQVYTNMLIQNNMEEFRVSCGKPASRLTEMTRAQVSTYLNATDFVAFGSTYHDAGMIWGTRLISPSGLFAADTQAWSGRPDPNRFIIFMTDGAMNAEMDVYGLYGMEKYANRVKGSLTPDQDTLHGRRFVAVCGAAKARGIKVYVIGYGQSLTSDMTSCASPGSSFQAPTDGDLNSIFVSIARDIAALRLSQ